MRAPLTLLALLLCWPLLAQSPPPDEPLVAALVAALKPALPYPEADDHHLPVNGSPAPPWIVRWPAPGDARVEIVANPLNPDNQQRANKAEEEIQRAVMAAQQKSQAQYERAVAEFEKTGKTNAIEGITLGDEGIVGERFDASNRVVVTLSPAPKEYRLRVGSSEAPQVSTTAYAAIVRVAANVYRERPAAGQPELARFHASEAHLWFGAGLAPTVNRLGPASFEVVAPSKPTAVVSIQGNEALVEQIVAKADWTAIASRLTTP